MTLNGARVYNEGVEVGHDSEERIRQIVTTIKTLSPSSDVSMRFLKCGKVYEGLLWGKTNDIPIGVYNRGPSINHVLDTIFKKVKKECLKTWRLNLRENNPKDRTQTYSEQPLAMAG